MYHVKRRDTGKSLSAHASSEEAAAMMAAYAYGDRHEGIFEEDAYYCQEETR